MRVRMSYNTRLCETIVQLLPRCQRQPRLDAAATVATALQGRIKTGGVMVAVAPCPEVMWVRG